MAYELRSSDWSSDVFSSDLFTAGVFIEQDVDLFFDDEKESRLKTSGALDFARFALFTAEHSIRRILHFGNHVVNYVIWFSRKNGNVVQALQDCDLLLRLGADGGVLQNQMAMTYFTNREYEKADEAIEKALQFTPDEDRKRTRLNSSH